jgi:heme A synthase
VLPWLGNGTIWEWSHRLLAGAVAPLVLALIVVGWIQRRRSRFVAPTVAAIAALFVVQLFLGAETVRLSNTPLSVVVHWATAMALIASLSAMAVFAAAFQARAKGRESAPASQALPIILATTAAAAFVTMCVGAYVSSSGAGLACLSIPGCAGNVVVYTPGQLAQMLHRIAAGGTLMCAAAAVAVSWAQPASARIRGAVALGAGLIAIQIVLGLLNVALRLPTDLREAHAVNAALLFLAFFIATAFALIESAPQRGSQGLVSESSAK